jgi:predicted N-acyltransferase
MSLALKIVDELGEVPQAAWNALLDARSTPFMDWRWLESLESSGSLRGAGWRPRHLTLWRGRALVAAAPAYVKDDSDGDFARDWDWGAAAHRARLAFYPKLCITVPFTPCTGRRFLVAPGEAQDEALARLVDGARRLMKDEGLGTVQVLFPPVEQAEALVPLGAALRLSYQFHWSNHGYRSVEDFLARLPSKKRTQHRRERAAPARQGIVIRTVRDPEVRESPRRWADAAHALHRSTIDKLMWGRGWLNRDFYRRLFDRMPEHVELVAAFRDGNLVAGAFNLASPTHLYGRYWGCFEDHPFLHFNVCLYHSIDECIARGVQVFEGGAGGEHKLARGFEPTETRSAHWFADPRLEAGLRRHLLDETQQLRSDLARWREESPVLKNPSRYAGDD